MPEKDYSHRSAVDKLGIQPGAAVRVVGVSAKSAPTLMELRAGIVEHGGIGVITAKRAQHSASGLGYLNQSDVIPLGLAAGLVDNKSCSVNEQESGLRFVIRKADRIAKAP